MNHRCVAIFTCGILRFQVKVLYVRNLKSDVSEEQLKEKFEPYGKIERVKKIKDYGFIHFEDRDDAVKAMEELNGTVNIFAAVAFPTNDQYLVSKGFRQMFDICVLSLQKIGESEMDISLAKPPSEKKKMEKRRR